MAGKLQTELYVTQRDQIWPKRGRHILAQYDDETVVVYQAYCPEIASYAAQHGQFGGPRYSFTRMTWIKTNFMWMMYRSNWAQSKGQERILAISVCRKGFDEILRCARGNRICIDDDSVPDNVRLQWDPDHSPTGEKLERRAVQLGLRGDILQKFNSEWIRKIQDITDFVLEQRELVIAERTDELYTPSEREYIPTDEHICRHIRLDGFVEEDIPLSQKLCTESVSILHADGACCSELLDKSLQDETKKQLSRLQESESRDVILCLGGAFNPVHTRHVQAMCEAKSWLEEHSNFKVLSGYLAVAPDGYVQTKCRKSGQKCISIDHRIRLCQIACEGYDWLQPYEKPVGSAHECGERAKKEKGLPDAQVAVICGADRAVNKSGHAKWHKKSGQLTVCVGRKGETEEIKRLYMEDRKMDIANNPNFFIVAKELDNVSSTEVRKMLTQVENSEDELSKRKIIQDIVEKGWLSLAEGNYILEYFTKLYL